MRISTRKGIDSQQLLKAITRHLGEKTLIKDLNEGVMDGYATQHQMEDSPARKGGLV